MRQQRDCGLLSLASRFALAATLAGGCASVPTFPAWQNISAERETRKQETLQHIDRTRGQAAEIEEASFSKERDPRSVVSPDRAPNRLSPVGESVPGMAVDPTLTPDLMMPTVDQELRSEADRAVAMGDLDEAIGLYRELIAKQPGDAQLHHALALVAEQMNLHEEASRHYLEALRLAPGEELYRLCYEAHADRLASERPSGPVVR